MNRQNLRLSVLAAALAAAAFVPTVAAAQEGPWLVRVRAVNLDSANKSDTTPDLKLSVNDKVIPEVDISYFFTPNLAAELVLTVPQKHDIRSDGTKIGTLKHLPPTLLAQYHFTGGAFKPYVGLGLNLTLFSDVKFDPAVDAALAPSVKSSSTGLAFQVGFDYAISKSTYLNVDLKKVQIGTDVRSAGTKIGTFKVDPTLVGVGLGWRF